MKKYKLNLIIKIMIYITIGIFIFALSNIIKFSIPQLKFFVILAPEMVLAVGILVFLFVFLIYMVSTIIKIEQETFKTLSIDFSKEQILLFNKENQVMPIPFEKVELVEIAKGSIFRGVLLGQVRISTKSPKIYSVTISEPDDLYRLIKDKLEVKLKRSLFFHFK